MLELRPAFLVGAALTQQRSFRQLFVSPAPPPKSGTLCVPILGTQFEVENSGFRNSDRWRNLRYRLQICWRSIAWYVGRSGLKGLARDANPAVWIPHQSYSLIVPAVRSPGFPLFSGEHIFGSMNLLAGVVFHPG